MYYMQSGRGGGRAQSPPNPARTFCLPGKRVHIYSFTALVAYSSSSSTYL